MSIGEAIPNEDTQEIVDFSDAIDKFRVVRQLGEQALEVEQEARRIARAIEQLHAEPLVAPPGNAFIISSDLTLDIFHTSEHPPQIYIEEYDADDDEGMWHNVLPDQEDPTRHARPNSNDAGQYFLGHFVEYDDVSKLVWVYNADHSIRARYSDYLVMDGFIPDFS